MAATLSIACELDDAALFFYLTLQGKGRMYTYWVVGREGNTNPLPDFAELSRDDDPSPRMLTTTLKQITVPSTEKRIDDLVETDL